MNNDQCEKVARFAYDNLFSRADVLMNVRGRVISGEMSESDANKVISLHSWFLNND